MASINRKLNIVIEATYGDGICYVHSVPVSREIFERHFWIFAKVYDRFMREDLNLMFCPKIAYLALKEEAIRREQWTGEDGIEQTLVAEIMRLTNVIYPTEKGFRNVPLEIILRDDKFDAEEVLEKCVFFTILASMNTARDQKNILDLLVVACPEYQTTSLNVTNFQTSLGTLSTTGNTTNTTI